MLLSANQAVSDAGGNSFFVAAILGLVLSFFVHFDVTGRISLFSTADYDGWVTYVVLFGVLFCLAILWSTRCERRSFNEFQPRIAEELHRAGSDRWELISLLESDEEDAYKQVLEYLKKSGGWDR
jgi:hypothetical protein